MQWRRDEREISTERVVVFDEVIPRLRLLARERTGPLRIGLWDGESLVVGWQVPHLPPDAFLEIEGSTVYGYGGDEPRRLHNFVTNYHGGWVQQVRLPRGEYRLTLDQHPDKAVDVMVEVLMTAVSE